MCDCQKNVEALLLERFKEQAPEASGHNVTLQGYAFGIGRSDNKVTVVGYMPYKTSASFPLKRGGSKDRAKTGNMHFNFCPFCGEKA